MKRTRSGDDDFNVNGNKGIGDGLSSRVGKIQERQIQRPHPRWIHILLRFGPVSLRSSEVEVHLACLTITTAVPVGLQVVAVVTPLATMTTTVAAPGHVSKVADVVVAFVSLQFACVCVRVCAERQPARHVSSVASVPVEVAGPIVRGWCRLGGCVSVLGALSCNNDDQMAKIYWRYDQTVEITIADVA
uniref:Uncharacterized protein n=1 Tax=Arundo donax TaxID=35708 RepID=A0A0A8YKD9_ARUDO